MARTAKGGSFLRVLHRMPRLRRALSSAKRIATGAPGFDDSSRYWEDRYKRGGNSGAGSYRRLAEFKAETLNHFIAANGIQTVIEFGSGDGAQLALARYPAYVGVDVSWTAVAATREKFAHDSSKRFLHTSEVSDADRADAALSLDVIYHLVEDVVFDEYMHALFNAASRFVVVYSSNFNGAGEGPHVRHRQFTDWVAANRAEFSLSKRIPNRYPYSRTDPDNTSFADFYIYERIEELSRQVP
jgi:hypothetical protein